MQILSWPRSRFVILLINHCINPIPIELTADTSQSGQAPTKVNASTNIPTEQQDASRPAPESAWVPKSLTPAKFSMTVAKNGIRTHPFSTAPGNMDMLRKYLAEGENPDVCGIIFARCLNMSEKSMDSSTLAFEVGRDLLRPTMGAKYPRAINKPFQGFPRDANFTDGLPLP